MTQSQQQWVLAMKTGLGARVQRGLRPPRGYVRRKVFEFVVSNVFEFFIMMVIFANVVLMAMDYYGIEKDVEFNFWYMRATNGFAYIYYSEAVLKLIGLGCQQYFASRWCQFDFFLVAVSLFDQFGSEEFDSLIPMPPMLLRVLRLLCASCASCG